jgi:hypothetical protein
LSGNMATGHLVDSFNEGLSHIAKDGATGPLVTNMMAKCRKLLEGTATKTRYPVARLFGNWVLHTELTSDRAGIEILEQMNQFIVGLLIGVGGVHSDLKLRAS